MTDQDDQTTDELWRSIVAELAPTDDELARATIRRRDTDWRPLPRLPISDDERLDPPGGAWWRRRAGVTFTIIQAQTWAGHAMGLMPGGWVSTANGIPLVSIDCPSGYPDERWAKAFCDGLDLAKIGDFQI